MIVLGLEPSRDIATAPALEVGEVATAVDAGRDLAAEAARDGITVLVGGEMGIGNTTPATCLAAWLTGRPGGELAGPGTGLDGAGLARKRAVVERALALHGPRSAGRSARCAGSAAVRSRSSAGWRWAPASRGSPTSATA